jgi:hypothetical protein
MRDGTAVAFPVEALPRQFADLVGAPPGVDDQIDGRADVCGADALKGVEVGAELTHDFRRQVTAGFGVLGVVGDVLLAEGEVVRQAVQGLAGLGQTPAQPAA